MTTLPLWFEQKYGSRPVAPNNVDDWLFRNESNSLRMRVFLFPGSLSASGGSEIGMEPTGANSFGGGRCRETGADGARPRERLLNRCYPRAMPLTPNQRHSLLLADQSHDTAAIAGAIEAVLRDNPTACLLEIELAFRDSAAAAYLVATTERFQVVLGMLAMLAAVGKAGKTPAENRAALAGKR